MEGQLQKRSAPMQAEACFVDITGLCRMCTRQCNEDDYSFLFTPGSPVAVKLRDYLNIELEAESTFLPKQICQACSDALDRWAQVREYVQKSQEFYQQQLELRGNLPNLYQNNLCIKNEDDMEENMTININPELLHLGSDFSEYSPQISQQNKRDFPCGRCSLGFDDINQFANHFQIHPRIKGEPCGHCGSKFKKISLLLQHLLDHKNNPHKKLTYKCDTCNTTYSAKKNLLSHIKTRHADEYRLTSNKYDNSVASNNTSVYKCGTCTESYEGIKEFAKHFPVKHSTFSELLCGVCNCRFRKLPLLLRHEQNHKMNPNEVITFPCSQCSENFSKNAHLLNHVRAKHSGNSNNCNVTSVNTFKNMYKCGICKIEFTHIVNFAKHFPVVHGQFNQLPCGICGLVFLKLPMLLRHEQDHRKVIQINRDPSSFTCKYCSQNFYDHAEFCTHVNKHEPTICPHCKTAFETKKQLQAHIVVRHPEGSTQDKRIPCPICGKFFRQNSSMKAHMELHSNDRNYVCEFCSKTYRSLSTLLHHRRLHTSNRKFICNFCERPFNFKSAMKKHIMLHINYLPHRCKFCTKKYNTVTMLKKHVQMKHLGILHHCVRCNKGFHDIRNCRRHMKTICRVPFEEIPYVRDRQFIYNQAVV